MPVAAVHGLAITGRAVAEAFSRRGWLVRLADDAPTARHAELAAALGGVLHDVSTPGGIAAFLDGVDVLVPAPGVPPASAVISAALSTGVPVRSEIDIAYEWEQARPHGGRPVIGITGTDGKTTTTMIAAHLLRTAGLRVEEVGNTDLPFMAAVDDGNIDAFVVECSSFRLQWTRSFRCHAATWLNFAPDHLDWHRTLEHYRGAKEKIWAHARTTDVAVVPSGEPSIVDSALRSGARVVTFGLEHGDYRVDHGDGDPRLVGPGGTLCRVGDMWRSMPHDITNSLAASALVLESGLVPVASVAGGLGSFVPARHRIELVGTFGGTQWYDDSKATSPHAALTAIRAFDRLVLIAGGKNKDLDLSELASEPQRMQGVVAIGDDADLVARAFTGICEVRRAGSMAEAVSHAAALAAPGVPVVLSPGCTSYDWYGNYNERGDDFQESVRRHHGGPDQGREAGQ